MCNGPTRLSLVRHVQGGWDVSTLRGCWGVLLNALNFADFALHAWYACLLAGLLWPHPGLLLRHSGPLLLGAPPSPPPPLPQSDHVRLSFTCRFAVSRRLQDPPSLYCNHWTTPAMHADMVAYKRAGNGAQAECSFQLPYSTWRIVNVAVAQLLLTVMHGDSWSNFPEAVLARIALVMECLFILRRSPRIS